ncbi:competence type IV pilus minor pilin ComGF [Heyndrickxia camelliae]|nr:competence type IV pilus minor pilin ComGF [Heyndrickxia camelliae]
MIRNKIVLLKRKNEKGFTLVESIITLMIAVVILSIIPLVMKGVNQINHSLSTEDSYEWNIFLMQLRRELRNCNEASRTGNKLILQVNGEKVSYEPFGLLLRRRVNDTGHEVVLQKVRRVEFAINNNHITLSVQFTNNKQVMAEFTFFNPTVLEDSRVGGQESEK